MKTRNHITSMLLSFILFFTSASAIAGESSLKDYKIKKISLRIDTALWIQGSKHEIGLVVFTEDDRVFNTRGFLDGSLKWNNFIIKTTGADYGNGKLKVNSTPDEEYVPYVTLQVSSKYDPEKLFSDTIWLNYETSIHLFPVNRFRAIPGTCVRFGMEVYYDNGRMITIKPGNALKNLINDDYEVIEKGTSYKNCEFTVSRNVLDYPEHKAGVLIQQKVNHEVYDILEVQLDYRDNYKLSVNGISGTWGFSGFSGSSGSTGEHGKPGEDGDNGSHGQNGHDLDVFTDIYFDSILQYNLIKVYIEDIANNSTQHYLINPQGGNLNIDVTGGNGGNGGDGGSGGNGCKGYTGEFYTEYITETIIRKDTAGKEIRQEITRSVTRQRRGGDGGWGGDGGYGGIGGNGGNGGYVIVYYTPAMKDYLDLIRIKTSGGSGGMGGDGGHGGAGGLGGDGNPKGRSGGFGKGGLDGPHGYDGSQGRVEYKTTSGIPW